MNLHLTKSRLNRIRRLARDQCCNFESGDCLLLDDGDSHPCVQVTSDGISCKYFLRAVLPLKQNLYETVILKLRQKGYLND